MKYDEDTLNWIRDKTNFNILRFNQKNLNKISSTAKHELLKVGFISKSAQNSSLQLTEKGRSFLEESENNSG